MKRGAWIGLAALLLLPLIAQADETFEQILVRDISTPSRFTSTLITPDGTAQMLSASCRVRNGEVSVTYDGTTPTTGVGMLVEPGEVLWLPGHDRLVKFRAVPTGAGAQMDCTYSSTTVAPARVEIMNLMSPARAAAAQGPPLPLPTCNAVRTTQCRQVGF